MSGVSQELTNFAESNDNDYTERPTETDENADREVFRVKKLLI